MEVFEMVMQMEREEGLIEGSKKQTAIFIENMLRSTNFSNENIASLAEVSPTFVAEVKARLNC